jgi:membrane fusion protein, multidrug efflux system
MRRTFVLPAPLLALGLSALLLTACHNQSAETVAADAGPAVHVATAVQVEWPGMVSVPGTVSAVDTATLASRAGGQVTRVEVVAGARVAQGELLAEVGIADARSQLEQAEARLATAKATFDQATADQQRYEMLYRSHATSAQQYEAAQRSFLAAKAEVGAATSALTAAKSNLTYAEIRAPFAGVVAEKDVKVGDFAAAGTTLFVIAGNTPEIHAYVSPAVYATLKVGNQADVVVNGTARPAVITLIDTTADPNTHTHLIELHLHGTTMAPFGAYAEVRLTSGRFEAVAVPIAALVSRAGLLGVFVVDKDHRAHFRLVRPGQRRDGQVAIVAGLTAGEMVITAPTPALGNDSPVTPKTAAPATIGLGASHG